MLINILIFRLKKFAEFVKTDKTAEKQYKEIQNNCKNKNYSTIVYNVIAIIKIFVEKNLTQ